MKSYYVYIMTNLPKTLYTGVTNDLIRRVFEHKQGVGSQFTRKYRMTHLIHFEETQDVQTALTREKQIKGWTRAKKLDLINVNNPAWKDLATDWDDSKWQPSTRTGRTADSSLRSE